MMTRNDLHSSALLLQVVVIVSAGALLGAACALFPPLYLVGALAALVLGILMVKRPEIGLLTILLITSSVIFENTLPILSIGVGSLNIPDFFLIGLLGLIIFRWWLDPKFRITRTPLDWLVLVFICLALVATFAGVLNFTVSVVDARQAFRHVSYFLTFFIVTNLIREDRQIRFLVNGIFFIACVAAIWMIAQYIVGSSIQLVPGYVYTLSTAGQVVSGATRVVPPGRTVIVVSFIALTVIFVINKFKVRSWWIVIAWILVAVGLILTFLRSYWVTSAFVFVLLAYLVRGQTRSRLVGWAIVVTLFLVTTALLINFISPDSMAGKLVTGSVNRLTSLASPTLLQEDSLQWRFVENEYAVASIKSHPLLGLGLGAYYRPFDYRIDVAGINWDPRNLLHNGFYWVIVTMGLPAFLILMCLCIVYLIRGFSNWRFVNDTQLRATVLGLTLALLATVLAAFVNTTFNSWIWTPVLGIMFGVNEVAYKKIQREGAVDYLQD